MKTTHSILLVATAMLAVSCSDFLEPKSSNEFVPKDAQALNELLLGEAYPLPSLASSLNTFMGMLDDDVTAAPYQDESESFNPNNCFVPYTWQGDIYAQLDDAGWLESNTNMYAAYYRLIKAANAVLDYVGNVTDSEDNKNYVRAQAYALRAFYYLNLVNLFGEPYNVNPKGLGVPLKRNSGIESNDIVRNTVEEVYEMIVSDLLNAERMFAGLDEERQYPMNYRVGLPMVRAVLARAYLYMEQWENASHYAKLVMDDAHFALLDLNNVPLYSTANQVNDVRWFMNYHSFENNTETLWVYGGVDDMTQNLSTNMKDEKERVIHPYFRASDELLASFDNKDLRRDRYIVLSWFDYKDASGMITKMPQALGKVYVTNSLSTNYDIHVAFWPVGSSTIFGRGLRLSEQFLNYAEAEANLALEGQGDGHRENAIQALNTLRTYRYAPNDYAPLGVGDDADLLQTVHKERRRELCFEGHRWFDLRRWGMPEIKHVWYPTADDAVVYTLRHNDPSYTLPIPNQAMELNPSLKQNALPVIPRGGETYKTSEQ